MRCLTTRGTVRQEDKIELAGVWRELQAILFHEVGALLHPSCHRSHPRVPMYAT